MNLSVPRRTTAKPLAIAATVAVVLTAQVAVAGTAEAAPNRGTPAVTTQRMTDATLHSTQHGTYAKGGALVLECYKRGQNVKGAFSPWIPGGWDNLWYRVDDGHYVADVDLSTGSNDPVTGPCPPPTPPPPAAPVAVGGNTLQPGQALAPGQSVRSSDGRFLFVQQGDGNLVLYAPGGRALWDSRRSGGGYTTYMQGDGNLVTYAPGHRAVWSSNTWGKPASRLVVQDDGNVVIYAPGNRAVWATNTVVGPASSGGQGSSSSARAAVTWANAQVGSGAYVELCQRFVENAYGTQGRFASAMDAYNERKAAGAIRKDGTPPAGALVFSTSSFDVIGGVRYGHVMISRGDGTYVSGGADGPSVKVYDKASPSPSGTYLGWAEAPKSWPGR